MINQRIINAPPSTHKDFIIMHAHMSRIAHEEIDYLRATCDFVIGQVSNRVSDVDVPTKGSQYFIKDLTEDKRVRKVFEQCDLTKYEQLALGGCSLSQSDLVEIYTEQS